MDHYGTMFYDILTHLLKYACDNLYPKIDESAYFGNKIVLDWKIFLSVLLNNKGSVVIIKNNIIWYELIQLADIFLVGKYYAEISLEDDMYENVTDLANIFKIEDTLMRVRSVPVMELINKVIELSNSFKNYLNTYSNHIDTDVVLEENIPNVAGPSVYNPEGNLESNQFSDQMIEIFNEVIRKDYNEMNMISNVDSLIDQFDVKYPWQCKRTLIKRLRNIHNAINSTRDCENSIFSYDVYLKNEIEDLCAALENDLLYTKDLIDLSVDFKLIKNNYGKFLNQLQEYQLEYNYLPREKTFNISLRRIIIFICRKAKMFFSNLYKLLLTALSNLLEYCCINTNYIATKCEH